MIFSFRVSRRRRSLPLFKIMNDDRLVHRICLRLSFTSLAICINSHIYRILKSQSLSYTFFTARISLTNLTSFPSLSLPISLKHDYFPSHQLSNTLVWEKSSVRNTLSRRISHLSHLSISHLSLPPISYSQNNWFSTFIRCCAISFKDWHTLKPFRYFYHFASHPQKIKKTEKVTNFHNFSCVPRFPLRKRPPRPSDHIRNKSLRSLSYNTRHFFSFQKKW